MNTSSLLPVALLALALPAVRAAEPAAPESSSAAEAVASAAAAAAETVDVSALRKELQELQAEIRKARLALERDERIAAIRALEKAAADKQDFDEARKRAAEARELANQLLAEQPGMADKLARILEIGTTLRGRLPAELLRKGKRLPKPASQPAAE